MHGREHMVGQTIYFMAGVKEKKRKRERLAFHSPLQGHAPSNLRPSFRPHLLKVLSPPVLGTMLTEPLMQWPLGTVQIQTMAGHKMFFGIKMYIGI